MTKISNEEAYSIKPIPLETDIVFGTDKESSVKFSKNFQLGDLRSFFLAGLDPETGGTLKIHEIVISTLATDIATTVNQMVSTYTVSQYEVLFFRVAGKLYVLKPQDVTIGLGQPSLSNSDFIEFPTSVGPTGPAGTNGTNGIDGTNGSVWRTASGAPSNSLGVNGDYYLNSANGDVYTKTSGTYAVVANIKGANGTNGINGTNGNGIVSVELTDTNGLVKTYTITFTDSSTFDFDVTDATADNLYATFAYPTNFTAGVATVGNQHNNRTLYIDNGSNNVQIKFPAGLSAGFECGFIQLGTGEVEFIDDGTSQLISPIGLKIKDQNYNAYVSQYGSTNIFYCLGNLKP